MSRLRTSAYALLLAVAPLGLAACSDPGSGSEPTTPAPTTAEASPTAAASSDSGMGTGDAGTFVMRTADDITITGTANSCDNPLESTLVVTFTGEGNEVSIDATEGTGTITVEGVVEFEGRVETVEVGDAGGVVVTGSGSLADPGATPTTFEVTGTCP